MTRKRKRLPAATLTENKLQLSDLRSLFARAALSFRHPVRSREQIAVNRVDLDQRESQRYGTPATLELARILGDASTVTIPRTVLHRTIKSRGQILARADSARVVAEIDRRNSRCE